MELRSGVIVWLGAPLLVFGRWLGAPLLVFGGGLCYTDEFKNIMVTSLVLDAVLVKFT